jgi:hypothetical protein
MKIRTKPSYKKMAAGVVEALARERRERQEAASDLLLAQARQERRALEQPRQRKMNLYGCESGCGFWLVSEDLVEGVTPFLMSCRCGELAASAFYRVPRAVYFLPADVEWYRPEPEELAQLSDAVQEHVAKGGLHYRVASPRAEYLRDELKRSRR